MIRNFFSFPAGKKIGERLTLMLAFVFVLSSFTVRGANGLFGGGNGTSSSPYLIEDAADLDAVRGNLGAYYKLVNDIDLTAYLALGGAGYAQWGISGWEPINGGGNGFAGNLDGAGHKITGLWINRPTSDYVGLFGIVTDATIYSLGVEIAVGKSITGKNAVGGLVGEGNSTFTNSISQCYVKGDVVGNQDYVGGLVGTARGFISNCYTETNVSGVNSVGGLLGRTASAMMMTIIDCYAAGTVKASGDYAGGLVGNHSYGGIQNCVAANDSISIGTGANIGRISAGSAAVQNNYALNSMIVAINGVNQSVTDNLNGTNGMGATISDLKSLTFYTNTVGGVMPWNFLTSPVTWNICDGIGLPFLNWQGLSCPDGTPNNPYLISTAKQLDNIRNDYSAHYKLVNDIDLTNYLAPGGDGYVKWNTSGWSPIDDGYAGFTGRLNGAGHKITGFWINRPSTGYIGLFGYTSMGAIIDSLGLEIAVGNSVNGSNEVGALVGFTNDATTISSCYVIGDVIGNSYVGGLVGRNSESSIINCYAKVNVIGTSTNTGGLVGISTASPITNCYAMGSVRGLNLVGGLAGSSESGGTIQNCIAANDTISGANIDANRITGGFMGTLQNNYALGSMVVTQNNVNQTVTDNLNGNTGMGTSLSNLKSLAFYTTASNWNNSSLWSMNPPSGVWDICNGVDLPFLRWQGVSCPLFIDTITASSGLNGTIAPSGKVTVNSGDNQTFVFTPNTCFKTDSLWIDGVYSPDSIAKGSYTFNNVSSNHTIKVNFKLLPIDTATISYSICYGKNYTLNGFNITNATVSGPHFKTDQKANGCDSVTRLNLTVYPNIPETPITASICQGGSYPFNGQTLTTSGVYYDTLTAISTGCDSLIKLTLTVNLVVTTPITASICEGYSYPFNGQTLTTSGTYYDTLTAISTGCDSIIKLTLTVKPVETTPITASICEGYSYPFNGQTLTTSGTYYDTLTAISTGCDSIVKLTLTVKPVETTPITASICEGYSYPFNGQTLTTSGTYYDTLMAISTGCDSIIKLMLTVNPLPDQPTISQNGNVLTSSAADSYQWYLNDTAISGATEQDYTCTQDGIYSVEVANEYGCSSISEGKTISVVGIVELQTAGGLQVYPNPTDGKLRIENYELQENTVIEIFDVVGKKLSTFNVQLSTNEVDISHLPAGLYFLKIDGKTVKVSKN